MARLIIDNITFEQAKVFAGWYEGQGEQDAGVWFDEHNIEAPMVNVQNRKWKQVDKETETVTIDCSPRT